jgi:hypothetical protein
MLIGPYRLKCRVDSVDAEFEVPIYITACDPHLKRMRVGPRSEAADVTIIAVARHVLESSGLGNRKHDNVLYERRSASRSQLTVDDSIRLTIR